MWGYRLEAPRRVERVDLPEDVHLDDGEVRLRLRVAGICGSDMPRFTGRVGQHLPYFDHGSAPVHEVVGTVVETRSPLYATGDRVVGTLGPSAGLAEYVVVHESRIAAVPPDLDDLEAIVVQPLSTVLRAVTRQLSDVSGRSVAVLGAGPCGLAFCHVLRTHGAERIVAVDPVERSETATAFGADELVATTAAAWQAGLTPSSRPDLVVEAVGHQQATIADALRAVADRGFVFGFGAPDDADYAIPYLEIYLRDLTLASGRTIDDWPELLAAGARYLEAHRSDFASYVSHVVAPEDAQRAYDLYAVPQPGRLKVVIATQA
jgi:threonine dehydrogenase-like Zn-dependent dehydrogenase